MKRSLFIFMLSFLLGAGAMGSDIVYTDDLIVICPASGGMMVGVDAASGILFGNDTLYLREDVLRIHFMDTSVSPGFPGNDWRLIVNGLSAGDGNFFGFEDSDAGEIIFRVDAGAPMNAVRAGSAGLGLGVASPGGIVHVGAMPGTQTGVIIGPENTVPDSNVLLQVQGRMLIDENLEFGSSRSSKADIKPLDSGTARSVLEGLVPTQFRYLNQSDPELGFIAEDLPTAVAARDNQRLRPMDVIAVLTAVVQQQHTARVELENRLAKRLETVEELEGRIRQLEIRAERSAL